MARIVLAIALALFLPLAALMVVLSAPVCQALAEASIEQSAEHEHLVAVAMAVRDFSMGNNVAPMPVGEDSRSAITPDAISHLLDVRVVFVTAELVWVLLLVLLFIGIIVTVKRSGVAFLTQPLIIGGAIPLAAAALLGIATVIDFSALFTWMHGIFFADGTWTFPYDSLLIRALPYDFWVSSAAVWAGSMAALCIISIGTGLIIARRQAEKRPRKTGSIG